MGLGKKKSFKRKIEAKKMEQKQNQDKTTIVFNKRFTANVVNFSPVMIFEATFQLDDIRAGMTM